MGIVPGLRYCCDRFNRLLGRTVGGFLNFSLEEPLGSQSLMGSCRNLEDIAENRADDGGGLALKVC